MTEKMHSEAIANRTYSLTAYTVNRQCSSNEEYRYNNHERRRVRTEVCAVSHAVSAANHDCQQQIVSPLRCTRTNQTFTNCYCYNNNSIWWSSSSLTLTSSTTNTHRYLSYHHFHPKHFSLSYFLRSKSKLLIFFLVLSVLSSRYTAMASPVRERHSGMATPAMENKPWINNPCNIKIQSSSEEGGSSGSQDADFNSKSANENYHHIAITTQDALHKATETEEDFTKSTFGDPDFLKEFEWLSYDWLPKIPSHRETSTNKVKLEALLKNSYNYMQHFAVAIDQIVLDQILNDGNYVDTFNNMQNSLRLVLCSIQQALISLKISPNPDVTRDIMSEEYRSIESEVTRNVRDYIILRDYVAGLKYIYNSFHEIHRQLS